MLSFWQNFKLIHSPYKALPDQSSIAGNMAESEFAMELSKIKRVVIFKNKRIKDSLAGLHEIDFIILDGKKIYLVELKNWSGVININENDEWIQVNKQKTINHSNPLKKLLRNTMFFVNHLRGLHFDLEGYEIYPQVIFTGPNLRFHSSFKNSLYIKKSKDFFRHLHRRGKFNKFKKIGQNDEQLIKILSNLTVWSRLHLYGGKVILGSIRYFVINGKKARLPKHFRVDYDLKWNRKAYISFISSLLGRRKKIKIKSKIFRIKPDDSIGFAEAGKNGIKLFKFGVIDRIQKEDMVI